MSYRSVEQPRDAHALPPSIMAQTAALRVGVLALVLVVLWVAIAWAVALP